MSEGIQREVTTTLQNVLSLVNCAEDYGHGNSVMMSALAELSGNVTDAEIAEFAAAFMLPEMLARGYGAGDRDAATGRLTEWRDRYCRGDR